MPISQMWRARLKAGRHNQPKDAQPAVCKAESAGSLGHRTYFYRYGTRPVMETLKLSFQ